MLVRHPDGEIFFLVPGWLLQSEWQNRLVQKAVHDFDQARRSMKL
jgi:hypothetical protein